MRKRHASQYANFGSLPIVIRSWQDNWDKLSEYFQYTPAIRKLIYTTNTVEGYHRQIRKVTKNKGVFPSDTALEKLVYLAYRNIRKKWTMPLANWATISQQLVIKFGGWFKLYNFAFVGTGARLLALAFPDR